MCFSLSTPMEISRGLTCLWEPKVVATSSASITQDFDLELKELEMVYHSNRAAVEGVADRNGHIQKVGGEGKNVSWGCSRTKGKGHECELTKKKFLHSDLLKLCLKRKYNITEFFPDTTVFYD